MKDIWNSFNDNKKKNLINLGFKKKRKITLFWQYIIKIKIRDWINSNLKYKEFILLLNTYNINNIEFIS